jgi:hypothetical protein
VANVTEQQMKVYLQTFHNHYLETCERFLTIEQRSRLERYSLLPAAVTGYVSTQFGAGYEYRVGEDSIATRRGCARIEELWVGGAPWVARLMPFFHIPRGENMHIRGGVFRGGFPFRFVGQPSEISLSGMHFEANGWSREVLYAQLFTDRSEAFWSQSEAVRRAKDEVLQAQLDLQQSTAREVDLSTYLSTYKEKTVLFLGDFNQGRDRLELVRAAFDRLGYSTILLDGIPENPHYDLPQKFRAVASVCRFLVFDDTSPAGQIGEMFLAEGLQAIRIVLREGTSQSTFMTKSMAVTSTVIRDWSYDAATIDATAAEAAAWAESRVEDLAQQRDHIYPWRSAPEA